MPARQAPHKTLNSQAGPSRMDGFVQPSKFPAHISAHRPQPTKTLMRRAVKAPVIAAEPKKTSIQALSPLKAGLPSKVGVQTKLSSDAIDPMRSQRAASASRSHLVKHFTHPTHSKVHQVTKLTPQDARPAQQATAAQALRPTFNSNPALKSAMQKTSVSSRNASLSTKPALKQPIKPQVKKSAVSYQDSYEDQDIFEQALAHATGHEEPAPKESKMRTAKRGGKKHRKVLGFAAATMAFLATCAFVAYQNKSNIQLQLASAKAGFSASVPLYKPAGYNLGKLAYAPGSVAMAFQNSADNSAFSVTQKKSNWDSQTLLENFVATTNQPYQGYESAGRTIYVYGQGKATWVNGGIWYQIDGANNLTSDQIVKVAASM